LDAYTSICPLGLTTACGALDIPVGGWPGSVTHPDQAPPGVICQAW